MITNQMMKFTNFRHNFQFLIINQNEKTFNKCISLFYVLVIESVQNIRNGKVDLLFFYFSIKRKIDKAPKYILLKF